MFQHTKLYIYPFQNLSLGFILKIFLKFRKFQPRYSYKVYSYIYIYIKKSVAGTNIRGEAISFPELRSPWPAVRKRELWEQPFQACAIAWNRCRLRLRSEPDNQNSVISHCYFKMDAPRALVFRPLVKGNEALGTRLEAKPNAQGRESRNYHWFQWNRN